MTGLPPGSEQVDPVLLDLVGHGASAESTEVIEVRGIRRLGGDVREAGAGSSKHDVDAARGRHPGRPWNLGPVVRDPARGPSEDSGHHGGTETEHPAGCRPYQHGRHLPLAVMCSSAGRDVLQRVRELAG